ncbi:MAG: cytochrome P450, partial [Myxococcales bacterium]
PVIAVSVFLTLAATALHENPGCRGPLRAGDDEYLYLFAQEVRRFYPFFPATVARVRHDFEWRGYTFAAGTRAMLDIHGTNHDRHTWTDPGVFRPERFRRRPEDRFEFIAQGGGQHATHHRCPGEWITLGLIKRALVMLAGEMTYQVPAQDLSIDFQRLPALPRSGFVMTHVGGPTSAIVGSRRCRSNGLRMNRRGSRPCSATRCSTRCPSRPSTT